MEVDSSRSIGNAKGRSNALKHWKIVREDKDAKGWGKKEHVQFVIKRGLLIGYRKHKEILKNSTRMQLMMPEKLRKRVLFTAHESLLSAHQGIRRTQERISAVFYCYLM